MRKLDVGLHALEPLGHGVGGGTLLPLLVGRRQASGQFLLACGLAGAAGRRQRHAKDEMRIAVGRIPPHRLAQPVDRGLGVAILPVAVPEIEKVVRVVRIGFRRLIEVVRRDAGLRRSAAPELDDADVVGHRRGRLLIGQRFERGERLVVFLQAELREAPQKTRASR